MIILEWRQPGKGFCGHESKQKARIPLIQSNLTTEHPADKIQIKCGKGVF